MSQIWTDEFLNQLSGDAETDILGEVNCLFKRFYLAITINVPVYTLPSYVVSVKGVVYRGKKLDPLSWEEYQILSNNSYYVNSTTSLVHTGIPRFYALHPTNIRDIVFYPCPNESLVSTVDSDNNPYAPTLNEARCAIQCWRTIDNTDSEAVLPAYIDRRTRKAYILKKAFGKEGKGQDLKISAYYDGKYQYLIDNFKKLNNWPFLSKKYSLDDSILTTNRGRVPRPVLPTNFERVVY